jgi:hypothetical protein
MTSLLIALAFVAMLVAPCLVTMQSNRDKISDDSEN